MKTVITGLFLGFLVLSNQPATAQGELVGNGQLVKQQRTIGSFSKLTVRVGMRVLITSGNAQQAELEGESNVLEHVLTQVKNGELTVTLNEKITAKQTKAVTVTIHVPKLDKVLVSTGCVVTSELPLVADNLTLSVETGSALTAPITTKKLTLTVKEGSKASIQGTATSAVIQLTAAGRLDAPRLTINRADVKLESASQATIHVTETLSASADGVSTITYAGNPSITSQEATGMSRIRKQS
ncbi:head GIN domain-containing protein [Spirosoma agri]|uniref:DUF2807 domain-containing protein n=1 Tax=Spirosoma agri TaxID=1987381 RepID=A0A6M0IEP5_9BACT|nr:head GIN domain-containing protein [Spirosoma agri]NEU66317.1 DUF2807 domain-containing protein [Spirosoma agri]